MKAQWSGKKCLIELLAAEAELDKSVIFCNMTKMMKMTGWKKVFESKAFLYE